MDLWQNLDGFSHEYTYDPLDESDPPKYKEYSEKVSLALSKSLRELLIANPEGNLNISWKQGFYFNKNIQYGLWQAEGGPCGVIATV